MLKKITKPFILYIKKTEDGYKNRFGQVFRLSKKIMYVDRGRDLLGKANIKFLLGKFNGADKCILFTWLPKKNW